MATNHDDTNSPIDEASLETDLAVYSPRASSVEGRPDMSMSTQPATPATTPTSRHSCPGDHRTNMYEVVHKKIIPPVFWSMAGTFAGTIALIVDIDLFYVILSITYLLFDLLKRIFGSNTGSFDHEFSNIRFNDLTFWDQIITSNKKYGNDNCNSSAHGGHLILELHSYEGNNDFIKAMLICIHALGFVDKNFAIRKFRSQ